MRLPGELRTGNAAVVSPGNQVLQATEKQSRSPSREETLISDHVITIAGRSVTITSHDVFMAGVSIVIGLLFWLALYFSRKRIVVLKRSSAVDQLTFELSRIADALDRIANHPAERAIAAASRRQLQPQSPPLQRESQVVAHTLFRS